MVAGTEVSEVTALTVGLIVGPSMLCPLGGGAPVPPILRHSFNNSCHVTFTRVATLHMGFGWGGVMLLTFMLTTSPSHITLLRRKRTCKDSAAGDANVPFNWKFPGKVKWSYQSFFREHLQASLFRAGEMHKTRINSQPFQHLCCFNLPHVRSC